MDTLFKKKILTGLTAKQDNRTKCSYQIAKSVKQLPGVLSYISFPNWFLLQFQLGFEVEMCATVGNGLAASVR